MVLVALGGLDFGGSKALDFAPMPSVFQTLILGIVQGLAEFLPVSSSAHLILLPSYLHWPDPGLAFDVALHLGTLVGVLAYFWKDLMGYAQAVLAPSDPRLAPERKLVGLILLATIPGAPWRDCFWSIRRKQVFRSPALIALGDGIGLGTSLMFIARTTPTARGEVALLGDDLGDGSPYWD